MIKLNLKLEHLDKIKALATVAEGSPYQFLGYSLDLQTGNFRDLLTKDARRTEWGIQMLSVLLLHYAQATQTPLTGNLVKFRDLPGGYAYERAFKQRAIQPLAKAFGSNPLDLVAAASVFGGRQLSFGDASSEIPALEGIPITYVVWGEHEFPASANILYDSSACRYLPTEDLAVLGEFTTQRLIEAQASLKAQKKDAP